ncbi:MAG TPA: hypothetical protein VK112_10055 [Fodinibius sp.]|nr:hypothetical protein [Fodinibius sp.]
MSNDYVAVLIQMLSFSGHDEGLITIDVDNDICGRFYGLGLPDLLRTLPTLSIGIMVLNAPSNALLEIRIKPDR